MDAETNLDGAPPAFLLSRYRTEGVLGEGGLGRVVKAYDTRLKRMVAIKTLKRDKYTTDPDQFRALEERFAREAEAGSRMGSHPNLVTVYDLVTDDERTQYLILEYVAGGTLAERIKQGALPLADGLRLTIEIAQGLLSAHQLGLVHRDVKPANVFLGDGGRAQVGDFGIAQIDDISGRTRATSGHPGTPLYMSPEQERMSAYLRPASDQYSLGFVLFEMLTGKIYKRLGKREVATLLAAQPPRVRALIERMMMEDAEERYPSLAEVIEEAQAIQREGASAAAPLPPARDETTLASRDFATMAAARRDTPRVNLQPAAVLAPPRAAAPQYSRRAILIGAGGLAVTAGGVGAVLTAMRGSTATTIATATALPVVTSIASTPVGAAALIPPTASPGATSTAGALAIRPATSTTSAPTATTSPTPILAAATAVPPTATFPPTATPTRPPTETPVPTWTPSPRPVAVQTATWTDQHSLTLQYPSGWSAGRDSSDPNSVVEVKGGDVDFFVVAFKGSQQTPEKQVQDIHRTRPAARDYCDGQDCNGSFNSTTVGGESGVFMSYTSTSRSNRSDVHGGGFWVVRHQGSLYQIEAYTTVVPVSDATNEIINNMVRSIRFLS